MLIWTLSTIKGYRINGRDIEEVLKTICLNLQTQEAGITAPASWVFLRQAGAAQIYNPQSTGES